MADEWRSCSPPSGGRPYFVNLRTSETVWSLPAGILRQSVREFSPEDEDAIPAEKLIEVDDLAVTTPSTIECASEARLSKLESPVKQKSTVASTLVEHLMRDTLRLLVAASAPTYPLGLAASAAACCGDGAALRTVHLPLHSAVGRGSCFPGLQDLELSLAWRRRRMATAGFTGSRDSRTSYTYSASRATAAAAGGSVGSRRGSLACGDNDGCGSDDATDDDDDNLCAGAGATAGDEGSAWFYENVLTQETSWDAPATARSVDSRSASASGAGFSCAEVANAAGLWALPPGRELVALADPLPLLLVDDARAKIAAAGAAGGASGVLSAALSAIGILPLSDSAAAAMSAAEACADVLSVAADPTCTDDDRSRLATALCAAVSLGEDGSDATPLHAALMRLHAVISATLALGGDGNGANADNLTAVGSGGCDFGLARPLLPSRVRKRVRALLLITEHHVSGGGAVDGATLASGEAAWGALFSNPAPGGGTARGSPATSSAGAGAAAAPGWALVQLLARTARCPAIPPPTALVACQCLCALATAVDARVLDHWVFPAVPCSRSASDAVAKAPCAGAGATVAAAGQAPLSAVIQSAVRGLVASLAGPAAWAQRFASAAAAAFSPESAAPAPASGGGQVSERNIYIVTASLQAAVAAALQPAATRQRLSSAASWLLILECALQHAADRVVSDAAAVAAAPSSIGCHAGSSGCIAAVQEGSVAWSALTAVLLACIGAEEASAAAATAAAAALEGAASGGIADGAGATARAASTSSSAESLSAAAPASRSRSGSSLTTSAAAAVVASPLLTPAAQCLAALHRLFEVAVYSGAGEAVAAAAASTAASASAAVSSSSGGSGSRAGSSGSSSSVAAEARAALAALPETFGLVTPVVEEVAAATASRHLDGSAGVLADAGAARQDACSALVLPSAVRSALASALVSVLTAPPADAERRRRSRRLSRSRPIAARHAAAEAIVAAITADSGGAGGAGGGLEPVLLGAVFLPMQIQALSVEDSDGAAATLPAFSSSNGQWRGQRLAAVSLLCALLECPSAQPATLLYASDATCLVDVVLAELRDLPPGDHARAAWLRLLKSVLLRSQWSAPSAKPVGLGRYRLPDIVATLSGLSSSSAVLSNGVPEAVREVASLTLEAAADVLL